MRVLPAAASAAPEAVEAAFRRHAGYVVAIAMRLLGRDEEVEDVLQDVFLAAVRGLPRSADVSEQRAWLACVTVRCAGRRLRRRRLLTWLRLDDAPDYMDVASPAASPEQRALLARVYRALDEVPVAERLAWTLRHLEGEKLEEVARCCRCSLATAKRRVAAAQARLERRLCHG